MRKAKVGINGPRSYSAKKLSMLASLRRKKLLKARRNKSNSDKALALKIYG